MLTHVNALAATGRARSAALDTLAAAEQNCLMADEIRAGRRAVAVPDQKRSELIRRLQAAGYQHSATDLEFRRAIPRTDTAYVLSVLEVWFAEVGADAFGPELMELREALSQVAGQRT